MTLTSSSSRQQIQFVSTEFTDEMLDRFIFALHGRMDKLFITEKPLTRDKAIEYLGVSESSFSRLVRAGDFKAHYFKGIDTPFYWPAEMIENLKK